MYLFSEELAQLVTYVMAVKLQAFSLCLQICPGAQAGKRVRLSLAGEGLPVLAAAAGAAIAAPCPGLYSCQAEKLPKGQRVKKGVGERPFF